MVKIEMREVSVVYCDWCGEEITANSYSSVTKSDEPQKDFHSYSKKCIDEYHSEQERKYKEERKRKKENL